MSINKTMRVSKSVVGEEEAESVRRVIVEDGYLGMGKEVMLFEAELANYIGVLPSQVVCVNSGTAALHLALEAILNVGDEVLVQSFTYASTFQAITAAGGIPIACEVDNDMIIDLGDAKRKLSSKTKLILPVHYASNPGNLQGIYDFAQENNLRVLEDAAHAFGTIYEGKKIGSFGDIICFSFDGIKNITSGEGGMIVSHDETVLNICKDTRLLGVEKDTEKRFSGERSWDFDIKRQGYRYHMSNIFAAIGRIQLQRLETEFAPKRVALAIRYQKNLEQLSDIKLPIINSSTENRIVPHIFPIRVLNGKLEIVRQVLKDNQVQTGVHYKPNHLHTFFKQEGLNLPNTEKIYSENLTLPLHPELTFEEIDFICSLIKKNI